MPVSYAEVCEAFELRRRFSEVAEDDPPAYGKRVFQKEPPFSGVAEGDDESFCGTDEELYQGILSLLADEYLEERYSLCLEIREGDRVVHAFPKVACPELILQQLQLKDH